MKDGVETTPLPRKPMAHLGLIGTLGWELMQMDDGTFERPKAGAWKVDASG